MSLSRQTSSATLKHSGSRISSERGDDKDSITSPTPLSPSVAPTPVETASIFEDELDGDTDLSWTEAQNKADEILDLEADIESEFDGLPDLEEDDDRALAAWKRKRKHFIILSAAGKPIYTRHGSSTLISSYVGVIQTILAFYTTSSDNLRSFATGSTRFVILSQNNLHLVAVSSLQESDSQLRVQLDALYMQILSTLTLPTLTHIFSVRPQSDLSRPLQGTEVLLSSLADSFTRGSASTLLSSLECLKLRKSQRATINSTFIRARVDDLLYGLIVAGGRLVSVIRPKKHSLHPSDLQLIFNMLFEAEGIKAGGGDSWIPICLPGFNNTGYLYMYVSFLDMQPASQSPSKIRELSGEAREDKIATEDSVAIILLSTNKESFESLRSMKSYVVHDLHRNGSMRVMQSSIRAGRPSIAEILSASNPNGRSMSRSPAKRSESNSVNTTTPTKSSQSILNALSPQSRPQLKLQPQPQIQHPLTHFLYKSKPHVQFLQPSFSSTASTTRSNSHRYVLHKIYASLHSSLHPTKGTTISNSAVKVHHAVSDTYTALAWSTPTFELYCIAPPGLSRPTLAGAANKVVQWVKKEEERVFIIGGAVF